MSDVVSVALGIFFVVSGAGKIVAFREFRSVLATTYQVAGDPGRAIAIVVPSAEIIVAGLLWWPEARGLGYLLGSVLLSGFFATALTAWAHGESGDCGCLGVLRREPISGRTLLRTGILAVVALGGLALSVDTSVAGFGFRLAPFLTAVLAAVGAALFGTIVWATIRIASAVSRGGAD